MAITVVAINGSTTNKDSAITQVANDFITRGVREKTIASDCGVTQNGTPNMSVNVAAGVVYIPNSAYAVGGSAPKYWILRNTATVNVAVTANASGNPRIDIVTAKIDTGAVPGVEGAGSGSFVVTAGTPAASPTAPATPSDHVLLAQIAVANGASSITTANITDKRNTANVQNVVLSDGQMLNGQISVSVATNDLTVSILTMNGETPSASNPVQVRLGNEIYKITAALTKTLNDGTNWFNAGASELATKSIQYATYLGVTSGTVFLGFGRRFGGETYADFSGTTTSENHLSTSTTPSASDIVRCIGQFTATLSAGAAYTWSISGTGSVINSPVTASGFMDWTPTLVGFSVAPTSTIYQYRMLKGECEILFVQGADGTSNATSFTATLPFTTKTLTNYRSTNPNEARDNTADSATPGRTIFLTGATTVVFNKDYSGAAWTAAGGKRIRTTGRVRYDI